MDTSGRAGPGLRDVLTKFANELLDRFDDLGIGEDVLEGDLLSEKTTSGFRSAAAQLADAVVAATQSKGAASEAAAKVRSASIGDSKIQTAALDGALRDLLRQLDADTVATSRLQVVDELLALLQATRLCAASEAGLLDGVSVSGVTTKDDVSENLSDTLQEVHMDDMAAVAMSAVGLAQVLGVAFLGRSSADVIHDISAKADELLRQLPADFTEPLLSRDSLSEQQMQAVLTIDKALQSQQVLRRKMLSERAKVTLQAFLWSKRLQDLGTESQAKSIVDSGIEAMDSLPQASLDDVFSLCQADLAAMEAPVSCAVGGRESASVKSFLIGSVPDRGGRAEGREAAAAANMPKWAARRAPPATTGGRGASCGARGGDGGRGEQSSRKRDRKGGRHAKA